MAVVGIIGLAADKLACSTGEVHDDTPSVASDPFLDAGCALWWLFVSERCYRAAVPHRLCQYALPVHPCAHCAHGM
jgi:hypothetical protein